MDISVVIVTYKRPKDLENCLDSVFSQTFLPKEIIVVANIKDSQTNKVIEKKRKLGEKKNIPVIYLTNETNNSLSAAQNIGASQAVADIVSLIDDDIILDENYHREIIKIFKDNPQALGVQGYNQTTKENYKWHDRVGVIAKCVTLYNKIFQSSCLLEENRCRLLPSLCTTYPYPDIRKVINCEWLSGSAAAYKRAVLKEFPFDEKLKKYSWGEDQDQPYRIFKKYPKSLFLTPKAKFWHLNSKEGRIPNKELIYMSEVYELYLFYKLIDQTVANKIRYGWRKFGNTILRRTFFYFITLGRGNPRRMLQGASYYSLGALAYAVWHRKEIKKGDLIFFNKTLT